MEILKSMKNR